MRNAYKVWSENLRGREHGWKTLERILKKEDRKL